MPRPWWLAAIAFLPALTLESTISGMSVPKGTETSLTSKLDAVQAALDSGDSAAACQVLADLLAFTRAQSGKKISTELADEILSAAEEISEAIGC